jgi:hypothetical protein
MSLVFVVADQLAEAYARLADGDPRTVTGMMALRLAADYDRAPRAWVRAEIDTMVDEVTGFPEDEPSVLDHIQARVAVKTAGLALGVAVTDVPPQYQER